MATCREDPPKLEVNGAVVTNYIHPHSVNAGIPDVDIPPPMVHGELDVDEAVLEGEFPVSFALTC